MHRRWAHPSWSGTGRRCTPCSCIRRSCRLLRTELCTPYRLWSTRLGPLRSVQPPDRKSRGCSNSSHPGNWPEEENVCYDNYEILKVFMWQSEFVRAHLYQVSQRKVNFSDLVIFDMLFTLTAVITQKVFVWVLFWFKRKSMNLILYFFTPIIPPGWDLHPSIWQCSVVAATTGIYV